jgi:Glycosyl hydrolase family 79 C-terminal beta domain
VERTRVRYLLLAAVGVSLLALSFAVSRLAQGSASTRATDPTISATVGSTPSGQPLPQGFLGVSFEYYALHAYTGRDPNAVNPVLVALLRNLAPGQTPILRIGGDSADQTWWPIPGVIPPNGVTYSLTTRWLQTARSLAKALGARLIMGINLAADQPAIAAAESRALLAGIGSQYIDAFEIGNEPDVYGIFPWYKNRRGKWVWSRPKSYSLSDYIVQFSQWRQALPSVPVAGPAFAELTWGPGLPQFIHAEPGLALVTMHRYPLRACITDRNKAGYPTISALLNDSSSAGVAQAVAPFVSDAHASGLPFRLDELNSASCSGKRGVSNTFASALWMLDTLFNLASVGVDGINVHTLPGAPYQLFSFKHTSHGWEAFVHPEYYGMLMFGQAFPRGAQLLPVSVSSSGPLKVWATRDASGNTRVVVINKDTLNSYQLQLQVPGWTSNAQLESLSAPGVSATSGVKLGGQTFGDETRTGVLGGAPQTQTVAPASGTYTITIPPASAALLTQP